LKFNELFFFSLCSASCNRSRFGFYGAGKAAGEAIPDVFSGELLLPARKNLPEMHFKTEGTGKAAYIRTDKNLRRWRHGGRGQETIQTDIKG